MAKKKLYILYIYILPLYTIQYIQICSLYLYIDHYTISNSQHTCNCSNLSTTGPNNEHQTYINNPWTTAGPRRLIPQFDAPKKRNFLSSAAALALSSSAFNLASWQNMTARRNLPMAFWGSSHLPDFKVRRKLMAIGSYWRHIDRKPVGQKMLSSCQLILHYQSAFEKRFHNF